MGKGSHRRTFFGPKDIRDFFGRLHERAVYRATERCDGAQAWIVPGRHFGGVMTTKADADFEYIGRVNVVSRRVRVQYGLVDEFAIREEIPECAFARPSQIESDNCEPAIEETFHGLVGVSLEFVGAVGPED